MNFAISLNHSGTSQSLGNILHFFYRDFNSGKTATQSSVGWGGVPARGVDGKITGTWSKGTCTHSQNAGSNWWQVDLEASYFVDSVVIYNRMDACCQNRLNGAKVRKCIRGAT